MARTRPPFSTLHPSTISQNTLLRVQVPWRKRARLPMPKWMKGLPRPSAKPTLLSWHEYESWHHVFIRRHDVKYE